MSHTPPLPPPPPVRLRYASRTNHHVVPYEPVCRAPLAPQPKGSAHPVHAEAAYYLAVASSIWLGAFILAAFGGVAPLLAYGLAGVAQWVIDHNYAPFGDRLLSALEHDTGVPGPGSPRDHSLASPLGYPHGGDLRHQRHEGLGTVHRGPLPRSVVASPASVFSSGTQENSPATPCRVR